MWMCLNVKTFDEGRCNYCDARCPYFAFSEDVIHTLDENTIALAHERSLRKIEGEMHNGNSDNQES